MNIFRNENKFEFLLMKKIEQKFFDSFSKKSEK